MSKIGKSNSCITSTASSHKHFFVSSSNQSSQDEEETINNSLVLPELTIKQPKPTNKMDNTWKYVAGTISVFLTGFAGLFAYKNRGAIKESKRSSQSSNNQASQEQVLSPQSNLPENRNEIVPKVINSNVSQSEEKPKTKIQVTHSFEDFAKIGDFDNLGGDIPDQYTFNSQNMVFQIATKNEDYKVHGNKDIFREFYYDLGKKANISNIQSSKNMEDNSSLSRIIVPEDGDYKYLEIAYCPTNKEGNVYQDKVGRSIYLKFVLKLPKTSSFAGLPKDFPSEFFENIRQKYENIFNASTIYNIGNDIEDLVIRTEKIVAKTNTSIKDKEGKPVEAIISRVFLEHGKEKYIVYINNHVVGKMIVYKLSDQYGTLEFTCPAKYLNSDTPTDNLFIDQIENFSDRKGVGSTLVQLAYERSKELGLDGKVSLDAAWKSHGFYWKQGFKPFQDERGKQKEEQIEHVLAKAKAENKEPDTSSLGSFIMYLSPEGMESFEQNTSLFSAFDTPLKIED
jgi:hypothetical protein